MNHYGSYTVHWQISPLFGKFQSLASIKTRFAPCATLRLFFPDLLPDHDRVLYVDTDVVFLESPEVVWSGLEKMNSSQMVGLANENRSAQALIQFAGAARV